MLYNRAFDLARLTWVAALSRRIGAMFSETCFPEPALRKLRWVTTFDGELLLDLAESGCIFEKDSARPLEADCSPADLEEATDEEERVRGK